MEIQKATGIVLHSRHFGEADVLARIFTREYGKRNFVFKGLKKSRSRAPSAAEPGTRLELVYYYHDTRDYHTVNEFKVSSHSIRIRSDLKKILHLYFLLDIADKTTGYNDPSTPLFRLIDSGIHALAETENAEMFTAFFIIHMLRIHGILPDLSRCKVCGREDFKAFSIDTTDFFPVCDSCGARRTGGSLALGRDAREFIRQSLVSKYAAINHAHYDSAEILNIVFYLALFIENYFHAELKSKDMLFSIARGD